MVEQKGRRASAYRSLAAATPVERIEEPGKPDAVGSHFLIGDIGAGCRVVVRDVLPHVQSEKVVCASPFFFAVLAGEVTLVQFEEQTEHVSTLPTGSVRKVPEFRPFLFSTSAIGARLLQVVPEESEILEPGIRDTTVPVGVSPTGIVPPASVSEEETVSVLASGQAVAIVPPALRNFRAAGTVQRPRRGVLSDSSEVPADLVSAARAVEPASSQQSLSGLPVIPGSSPSFGPGTAFVGRNPAPVLPGE